MKLSLIILERIVVAILSAALAGMLSLWLVVIHGTECSWKQSFTDTARLAKTVTSTTLELLLFDSPMQEIHHQLRPEQIREATLVVLNDTGVSGIFSTAATQRFQTPRELQKLVKEFNRLLKTGSSSFYLILIDVQGQRKSYESINGVLSPLIR